MILLLVLLFFVTIFTGFLLNKFGVQVIYDQEEMEINLRIWILSIPIYPERKKELKKRKRKKPREKKKRRWRLLDPQISFRVNVRLVWNLLKSLLPVLMNGLHKLRGKIRVDDLEVRLIWAEEDPCSAAIHYGNLCGLVGGLLPVLSNQFILKRKKIDLSVDFQRDTPVWFFRFRVSITLAQLLYICIYTGLGALKAFLRVRKEGKENDNGRKETSGE